MKKKSFLLFTSLLLTIFGCSNSDTNSTTDLKGKVFYGVVSASCSPTSTTNLSAKDYVLMSFIDENGDEISYQPKPNTWYRMCAGSACMWAKTGSDVTPKDSPLSFSFLTREYSGPCK